MKQAKSSNQTELWVEACQKGDSNAFTKLFDAYNNRVYYFALSLLRNEGEAEEVMQEVFVKIWENRHQLNARYSFSSYLFTVTKNHILNRMRRKAHEKNYADYCRHNTYTSRNLTDDELSYRELNSMVHRAIDTLSPRKREIFVLSREKNMTYREIAAKLNISIKTVENQMVFALRQLRAALLVDST